MQINAPPQVMPSPKTISIIAPVVINYLLKLVLVAAY